MMAMFIVFVFLNFIHFSDWGLGSSMGESSMGEIDWGHLGIHRGNLIMCAGSERVTDRVCSIK